MTTKLPRWPRLRIAGIGLLALCLIWLVITRTFVAYLAVTRPGTALRLMPGNAAALLNLADGRNALRRAKNSQTAATAPVIEPEVPVGNAVSGISNDAMRTWGQMLRDADASPDLSKTDWLKAPAAPTEMDPAVETAKQELENIRTLTERSLFNDPLNAHAIGLLGELALNDGPPGDRAEQLMRSAAKRSLHESLAVAWLMQKGHERKDDTEALHWADVLLHTRSQAPEVVAPILARIAEGQGDQGALEALVAGITELRPQVFAYLLPHITDARTPLRLFLSLKDSSAPPTKVELRSYLEFLINHHLYEVAYYTWLQFLPPQQLAGIGYLFNGRFDSAPDGQPFDWVIGSGSGVTIEIAKPTGESDNRGLSVEFGEGRVDFPGVKQLLMLAPGAYQFSGKYKGKLKGRRGLEWRVVCAGGGTQPIGISPMIQGGAQAWQDLKFSFIVPATGCRAQYLALEFDARSASEQFVTGTIWYDELSIARQPGPS